MKKMKWKSSLTISLFNFDYLPDEDGKKVDAKIEDEDKKIWKNEFDFEFGFWIFHIKIKLNGNFQENLGTKNLDPFLRTFLINRGKKAKMKMMMKK